MPRHDAVLCATPFGAGRCRQRPRSPPRTAVRGQVVAAAARIIEEEVVVAAEAEEEVEVVQVQVQVAVCARARVALAAEGEGGGRVEEGPRVVAVARRRQGSRASSRASWAKSDTVGPGRARPCLGRRKCYLGLLHSSKIGASSARLPASSAVILMSRLSELIRARYAASNRQSRSRPTGLLAPRKTQRAHEACCSRGLRACQPPQSPREVACFR